MTTTTSKLLKPCPFCGEHPHMRESDFDESVGCHCGASGPCEGTKEEAIAAWNCRAARAAPSVSVPPVEQDERGVFEHIERASNLERDDEGDYVNPCVQSAWEGFQQGRAHARAASTSAHAVICQFKSCSAPPICGRKGECQMVNMQAQDSLPSAPPAQTAEPLALEACRAIVKWCDANPLAGEALWCVELARQAVAQKPAHTSLTDDARDAERYRRIRLGLSDRHGDVYAMVFAWEGDYPESGEKLDATIDAALTAAQSANGDTK